MTEEDRPILIDSDSELEILYVKSNHNAACGVAARVKSRGRSAEQKKKVVVLVDTQVQPDGAAGSKRESSSSGHGRAAKRRRKVVKSGPKVQPVVAPQSNDDDDFAEEPIELEDEEDEKPHQEDEESVDNAPGPRKADRLHVEAYFVGKAVPTQRARGRWPHRYEKREYEWLLHYEQACVDNVHYKLGDCVTVNGDGCEHLGRIVELYQTSKHDNWFRVQWFFRSSDTSIGTLDMTDNKRVFASELEDDNFLECITGKVRVVQTRPSLNFLKTIKTIPKSCDYYYDMGYRYEFSTFYSLPDENESCSEESSVCNEATNEVQSPAKVEINAPCGTTKAELTLLDLYSGCGGMSAGLCMGSALAGVKIVTKWALDMNPFACESLKHNHPETEVRNEDAEDFLHLLREWQKLCATYAGSPPVEELSSSDSDSEETNGYEVEKVLGARVAVLETSSKTPKRRLELKIRWKNYSSDQDTWEPLENLDCPGRIYEFVSEARKNRLLPLPGDVDIICGGPPCQGASGYNRFRNKTAPLECPKNRQMLIYMDIVEFLKPRFVLMENVVDILKFCGGFLGRYAMLRLVNMHYQAKLGLMVAGAYGLPQFRMRVFLWGAAPSEQLPPFPLPTHEVVYRGVVPNEFARNTVKYDLENVELEKALLLGDAISDLPPVQNCEKRNEMDYDQEPNTRFQHIIRSSKEVCYGEKKKGRNRRLHDHRPLQLNADDFLRTCKIPKRKGANFRDLGGLLVREDNTVELDLSVKRELLPSGKPLVPDYAISYVKGKSLKPFARLWWDETVPTVVTRAEPHNQRIVHPVQDRVLTIRENARLQGFPDWYKLFGPVKERYTQIGNAVAVPVARALGYSLAQAAKRGVDCHVLQLPKGFPCPLN